MIAQRRAKNLALAGVPAQMMFTAVMLVIWLWTGSLAAMSCTLLLAAALPLWLMAAFLFYVAQLERREAVELEELASRGAGAGTIFEQEGEAELRPAAARAAFAHRWIVPVFTLLWASLHAVIGVLVIRHLGGQAAPEIHNAAQGMLLSAVIGFGAFLLSRYCTGMGRSAQWRPLRATGSFLLLATLSIGAVIVALIGVRQGNAKVDLVIAYAPAVVMLVLAAELVVNLVMDFYRPRIPGRERRLSFDSRLLNLIAEPGRVGHSLAEALNYQFGFEVSKTWFYQLLSRAFVPLVILAVAILFAMSSIVIVEQGEQCVLLHWGKADPQRRTLGPGLHLKWPWPIDTVRRFETDRVHEILLGVGRRRGPEERLAKGAKGQELLLWTEEHGLREEKNFVLAVPPRLRKVAKRPGKRPPPPVNLIKLVVAVQYVIKDAYEFGYGYTDAGKLLEQLAYSEMSRYCASATLNLPIRQGGSDRPEAIMTYGRRRAGEELKHRIQRKADEVGLGVDIRYVALMAVHPPSEAAEAYQAVLEAERHMLQTRYQAQADANRMLVQVAGRPLAALKLALGINSLEELQRLRDNPSRIAEIVGEQIERARDDIRKLDEEIAQERLLGLGREGEERTAKQELRKQYARHLEVLRSIEAAPSSSALSARIAEAARTVEELFADIVGTPAKAVAEAEAYRLDRELTEAARAAAFESELLAYRASPNMYVMDRWLAVWDEILPRVRKYVLGVDRSKVEIRLDLRRQEEVMGRAFQEEEQ